MNNIIEEKKVLNWPWFYKNDNWLLLFAPNKVLNKDFTLSVDKKENYKYPIWGWSFYENETIAREELDITEEDFEREIDI